MQTKEQLESRLQELLHFTQSLEWSLPTATDNDDELRSILMELVDLLEVCSWELSRQLDARPATAIYFRFLILKSLDAFPIKSRLFEKFPVLAEYKPCEQPRDFPQEVAKHLLDASETFTQAQAEISGYLPLPRFPGLSERLVLVGDGIEPTAEMMDAWEKELTSILRTELQEAELQNREWKQSQPMVFSVPYRLS